MKERSGKLIIYWDYELQRGADVSPSGRHDWGMEDYRQTEKLLKLLDRYQVKTTFAVVGFAALDGDLPYHAPAQIREMVQRGHEVASHTWLHDWVPGLTYPQLIESLRKSKTQLESVTGQSVISFAPPWNAPRTFLRKTSFGLYDRRRNQPPHTDIPALCRALRETGYQTARIAYEPIHHFLFRRLTGKPVIQSTREEWVENILCLKVSNGGFDVNSITVVQQAAQTGKNAVIYGHPNTLAGDNPEGLKFFIPFLEVACDLREQGKLDIITPAQLLDFYSGNAIL